ncbi:MAG TPA: GAF domain-containing protein [Actinomycetes bacterium]|nr:GAF domain-containing protein [Actinomycetes bacterium]
MSEERAGDRLEWTPTTRLAAANRMRERLKARAGLVAIAEAAAHYFADTFQADAAAITLLRGDEYRTLITVGDESPGQQRHVNWEAYPTSTYPQITEVLRAGRGYVSSLGNPGGIPESQRMLRQIQKASCIGAPIVYGGTIWGEMFVSRRTGVRAFTGKDLAVALDLARQLGFRIGPAVVAHDANNPDWWPTTDLS